MLRLSIFTFALFALTANAHAQEAQTSLETTPVWAADCEKHNYRFLDAIEHQHLVSETDSQVVFEFDTRVVSCTDQVITTIAVEPSLVYVGISRSGFLTDIFGHSFVKLQRTANAEFTHVVLTFDKPRAFNKDHSIRKFDMTYSPWGATQWYFPWIVTLTKETDGATQLSVQVH